MVFFKDGSSELLPFPREERIRKMMGGWGLQGNLGSISTPLNRKERD
jgi:hypothetical protein